MEDIDPATRLEISDIHNSSYFLVDSMSPYKP